MIPATRRGQKLKAVLSELKGIPGGPRRAILRILEGNVERCPYIAETGIAPGTACVQGSAENRVRSPLAGGGGSFIGVYAYEANEAKAAGDDINYRFYAGGKR
jgi:hypothetical protein